MTPGRLYRLGGLTICVAALLLIVTNVVGSISYALGVNETGPFWLTVQLVSVASALIFALALPALYLYQARESRAMGLAGFVITFLANILGNVGYTLLVAIITSAFGKDALKLHPALSPYIIILSSVSALLLFVGNALFGLATLNANIFPRNAAWLLIAASILAVAQSCQVPTLSFSLGLVSIVCVYGAYFWMSMLVARRAGVVDMEQAAAVVVENEPESQAAQQ